MNTRTFVASLLGMDAANASLYDGASALAEALLMAARITRLRKVAVSSLFTLSIGAWSALTLDRRGSK